MVPAGSFLKASSTGAKTVKSPLFSVLTRSTDELTLPLTALTSVVRSGLFDAAVATGSWDMPSTEPAPDGTALAYSAQPAPTMPDAIASEEGELDVDELDEVVDDEVADPASSVLLPQADAASATPTAATVSARRGFMSAFSLLVVRLQRVVPRCCWSFGADRAADWSTSAAVGHETV